MASDIVINDQLTRANRPANTFESRFHINEHHQIEWPFAGNKVPQDIMILMMLCYASTQIPGPRHRLLLAASRMAAQLVA